MENENIVYGRLAESVHFSGYTLERAVGELKWLLEEDRWTKVGSGYSDVNVFIKSLNFSEFKFAIEQRQEIAKKLADIGASQRATAKMLGVNNATIHNDLKPVDNSTHEQNICIEYEDVTEGNVEKSTPDKNWLKKSGADVAKKAEEDTLIETRREAKKEEQYQRFSQLKEKELEPLTDEYDVIVIDPPWEMEKIQREVAPMQVGFDYPTMTIDDIKAYKLPSAPNCHVFMWITHKHLPFGFEIFKTWNVKYVCCFVWHKNGGFQPFGLPQYNCEFILYGRIGTPEFYDLKDFNVCFSANRTGHSEKPEYFYDLIKRVTAGKRTDIFNRREIPGFVRWGNEA
jgi:N6-adenosine-specific RNA methylase IME4/predicted transcriptional regulator